MFSTSYDIFIISFIMFMVIVYKIVSSEHCKHYKVDVNYLQDCSSCQVCMAFIL